ncbi:hypothetical protein J7413_05805 [Shimia sp. R10_1]|uniref:hypothetical protein n=1 Tax=Shimia sp. R10_1 TaxID=2821095 RepID=UPI001ADA962E|nr:hypothetical protein [Shimia sp. R10_1]MBO9473049.1 hypothetical protein [Shimia sp. R10_1]
MYDSNDDLHAVDTIAPEIIRVAVARIIASDRFHKIVRVDALLRFLAEEHIAGLGEQVSIQTLLPILYADFDGDEALRLARADAHRLASLLESYFAEEGRWDALLFRLDPTSLNLELTFAELQEDPESSFDRPKFKRHWALALVVAILAIGFVVVPQYLPDAKEAETVSQSSGVSVTQSSRQQAEGVLLPDAAKLEAPTAISLDALGRDHMFSFMDIARQKRVIAHSQAVIAQYPDYSGSFATAAHSLGSIAILMRGSGKSQVFLGQAQTMLDQARALAPEDSWTLSAAGWVAYARTDWDLAKDFSKQGYELSQGQRHHLIYHALISLFTGDFENAALVTDPAQSAFGTGNTAIRGFAAFYLKDYATAVESFELALQQGVAQNAVRAAYLAAAYQAEGRLDEAQQMISMLGQTWPNFRPELVHGVFAPDIGAAHEQRFLGLLHAAGWENPE